MAKSIKLAVYFNSELRAVKEMSLPFVIGRSQEANLTISHPMVSRRHCLFSQGKECVQLQDLGSLNGTLINGERIKEVPLSDNDEFYIGNIRFVFNPTFELADSSREPVSESDLVDAEIILEPGDEEALPLAIPLPAQRPPSREKPSVSSMPLPKTPSKPLMPDLPPPLPDTPPPLPGTQGSPKASGVAKPLPSFPNGTDGKKRVDNAEKNGTNRVDANHDDVIDLADIKDKEASVPASVAREQK